MPVLLQLLPDQHGRPDHPRVRREGDPDLRPRRGARAHAETAGPGQQVGTGTGTGRGLGDRNGFGEEVRETGMDLGSRNGFREQLRGTGMGLGNR